MEAAVKYADLPGHPGYRVGDDGSVWSCWKVEPLGPGGGTRRVMTAGWRRRRVSRMNRHGHLAVSIRQETLSVHRLVLLAFVGPCPAGMEACHNDGDPANNRLGNLRWDTKQANTADSARHGTMSRGERHYNAKLTPERVRAIRAEFAAGGVTAYRLGKKYGVNPGSIWRIVRRQEWKHVTDDPQPTEATCPG